MADLPKHQRRILVSLAEAHPYAVSGTVVKFAEPLRRRGLIEDTSGYTPELAKVLGTSSYKITPAGLELATALGMKGDGNAA
jgi:hypothetical protein